MSEKEKYHFLVERLYKECENSRGYMGVEWDNFDLHEGETESEALLHKVLDEMNVVSGNPSEYVEDEYDREYGEFKAFRTDKNLEQYVNRLRNFIKKYAHKVLEEEKANHFISESDKY